MMLFLPNIYVLPASETNLQMFIFRILHTCNEYFVLRAAVGHPDCLLPVVLCNFLNSLILIIEVLSLYPVVAGLPGISIHRFFKTHCVVAIVYILIGGGYHLSEIRKELILRKTFFSLEAFVLVAFRTAAIATEDFFA